MKKLYATLAFICISVFVSAQCFVQVICQSTTCYGACDGSAMAYSNGTPPFTYTWSPGGQTTQGINNLCAGTYTVTMIDSVGCMATGQCTVTQPSQLQAVFSNVVNPSCSTCCDGSFTGGASGGTSPYSYTLWPPSGPPYPWGSMSNACNGTYVLCVTDANGCYSCDTIMLSSPLSIAGNTSNENIFITTYDNGIFQLNTEFESVQSGEIVVTNVIGQDVVLQRFNASSTLTRSIDLSNQPAGIYFVSVITASGMRTVRVVKQ